MTESISGDKIEEAAEKGASARWVHSSSVTKRVVVNREGKLVLVNSQAVTLFGWQREELPGQKIEMRQVWP